MSSKYGLKFGSSDPRTYSGLSPTFLIFAKDDGTLVTPPSVSEVVAVD